MLARMSIVVATQRELMRGTELCWAGYNVSVAPNSYFQNVSKNNAEDLVAQVE